MMEEVLQYGTGGGVDDPATASLCPPPARPARRADGWFAGFTSKLICVVWVGFDDNRDFKLEGARSALPIWVEFMKRAHQHREYRNVHSFEAPDGIVTVEIDAETGELPTRAGAKVRSEVFIAGTQPVQHGDGRTQVAGWEPVQEAPASSSGRWPPFRGLPASNPLEAFRLRPLPRRPNLGRRGDFWGGCEVLLSSAFPCRLSISL